ncbi:MAG: hypothetical protein RIM72_18400 [Alphaproteobacteria bacterium]
MQTRSTPSNQQAYEGSWSSIEAAVADRLKTGDAGIGDILTVVDRELAGTKVGADAFRVFHGDLDAPKGPDGNGFGRVVAAYGRYQAVPPGIHGKALTDLILQRLPADVEIVVEFGSGVGQNLVRLALETGRTDIRYIACELTESGRRVTDRMAALMPAYAIETVAFDYNDWDFSFLDAGARAFAFTHFSIEQISDIQASLFEDLIDRCGAVSAMHLEPCGWQRFVKLRAWYDHARQSGTKPSHRIEAKEEQFSRNAAFWAIQHSYNRNLLEVIAALRNSGRIEVLEQVMDYYGSNPFHPGTLIHWTKQ